MTSGETFFDQFIHSLEGKNPLQTSGRWARFIGIVFIMLSLITLLTFILILAQEDKIAASLMEINHMSSESLEFIRGGGKWLFGIMIFAAVSVMLINAYWLIRFSFSSKNYIQQGNELELQRSFEFLNKYLRITVILGILSIGISVIAALFSITL